MPIVLEIPGFTDTNWPNWLTEAEMFEAAYERKARRMMQRTIRYHEPPEPDHPSWHNAPRDGHAWRDLMRLGRDICFSNAIGEASIP